MVENYTTDKGHPKVLQNIEDDVEEIFQHISLESESQLDMKGNREKIYLQGSKIQQGSRGKQQRDRRKLREKRRSTGVVHLETGKSPTWKDMTEDMNRETKKNTEQNEVMGRTTYFKH